MMTNATATPDISTAILSDLREAVTSVDPGAEVILFGSRARGEARADSDWDLLVLPGEEMSLSLQDDFHSNTYDIELQYAEAISTIFFPLKQWRAGASPSPLYDNIRREGICLMTEKERELFVRHKLEKAEEALKEVTMMYEVKHYGTTANRLYYAAFYGASALLAKHGYTSKTHVGIKTQLSQHFVVPGILDVAEGKLFKKLFDLKQIGDYGEVLDVTKEQLDAVLDDGIELVGKLVSLTDQA